MVSVDKAVVARLKIKDSIFEVLVDCEKALALKRGENIDIIDVLAVPQVFKDAKKGLVAPDIKENFGTENIYNIAEKIIKEGEVQLTQEYKNKLTEEKKKKIINLICMNAIDSRTNNPVPPKRIELAIEEIKFHINPFKNVEEQSKELIEKLRPVLPLRIEEKKLEIIFPPEYTAKAYGVISKKATITKDLWLNNGSWLCEITIPAGIINDFISEINHLTRGAAEIKIIN